MVLILGSHVAAANSGNNHFFGNTHRAGLMVGQGLQKMSPFAINCPAGYKVVLIKGQYFLGLTNWPGAGIDILFQPQLNFSRLESGDHTNKPPKGIEFGVNAGILGRKTLFDGSAAVYALVSAGPHFVSKSPEYQASGFIFSDNIAIGLNQKLSHKMYFDLRFGYRHLSNAGLNRPNRGINNWIIGLGMILMPQNTN